MFKLTYRKRLLACFVLILSAAVTVSADESARDNSIEPGSWSIQFSIDDDFQLASFAGSAISLKRHWSEGRALRGGLSFGARTLDTDNSNITPDTSYSTTRDSNQGSVSTNLFYMVYPAPDREVLLFFGAGPIFSYSRTKTNYPDADRNNYSRIWSAGLAGVFGVEWFASRSISLMAEYTGNFSYISSVKEAYSRGRTNKVDEQFFNIDSTGVRFGLSAYF
jgi:hypothetical protein